MRQHRFCLKDPLSVTIFRFSCDFIAFRYIVLVIAIVTCVSWSMERLVESVLEDGVSADLFLLRDVLDWSDSDPFGPVGDFSSPTDYGDAAWRGRLSSCTLSSVSSVSAGTPFWGFTSEDFSHEMSSTSSSVFSSPSPQAGGQPRHFIFPPPADLLDSSDSDGPSPTPRQTFRHFAGKNNTFLYQYLYHC